MSGRILITGGAGFIGSHTCLVLLEAGYDLVILDNFSNSSPEALERVAALADVSLGSQRFQLHQGDIRDPRTLDQVFSDAANGERPRRPTIIHFTSQGWELPVTAAEGQPAGQVNCQDADKL